MFILLISRALLRIPLELREGTDVAGITDEDAAVRLSF